jgi:hypothetical protein
VRLIICALQRTNGILSDFSLLKEYDTGSHHQFFQRIIENFGDAFFTEDEAQALRNNQESKENQVMFTSKVTETILPFCYFASSICSVLHQQENPLTAEDAYWLGEVDEIYGSDLPCMRIIEEMEEKDYKEPTSSTTEQPQPSSQSAPSAGQTEPQP